MFGGRERRQYKRIKKPFVIRFQVQSDTERVRVFPKWDIVTAQNLSAGGVLFNYDQEISVDALLDFKINFPILSDPIDCIGKVIRVDRTPQSSRIRVAAVFTKIDENDKKTVNDFAEKIAVTEPASIA